MKIVNVLVGGPKTAWPSELRKIEGPWIGVDRGALYLVELGVIPQIAIGDYDSLTPDELALVEHQVKDMRYSVPEKDATDSELGLQIGLSDLQAEEVHIYGATGGRLDHLLVNLLMILQPAFRSKAEQVVLIDRQNTVRFYLPGEHHLVKEPNKRYLAFVPLTAVSDLNLPDELYQLHHFTSNYPISFASNEFVDGQGHFSFSQGVVCVIQSRDLTQLY